MAPRSGYAEERNLDLDQHPFKMWHGTWLTTMDSAPQQLELNGYSARRHTVGRVKVKVLPWPRWLSAQM
jgi:hypothetical protein